jgi:hypothetical protein
MIGIVRIEFYGLVWETTLEVFLAVAFGVLGAAGLLLWNIFT